MQTILAKNGILILPMILFLLAASAGVPQAQPAGHRLKMHYEDRSLRIEAHNANLKAVLRELAATAGITIEYPAALERKVSLNRRGISVSEALKAMLKGISYVVYYSGADSRHAGVTRVQILGRAGPRHSPSGPTAQLSRRIEAHRRQIAALRRRLSTLDPGSTRGRRYAGRISRLEKSIERLERQMY
ncbi:MAG TPA: hypothetical protein VLT88_09320 [Desulfosarcina sp.]|nr:hypothetical protein [Desulfosarcina sp.]